MVLLVSCDFCVLYYILITNGKSNGTSTHLLLLWYIAMTIASSVVDVRDIEEEKLFFYRVGCVPEKYIWEKLPQANNGIPIVMGKFSSPSQIKLAQNLMAMVTELMSCVSWCMFLPCPSGEQDSQPWHQIMVENSHVASCFETGIYFLLRR